MRQLESTFPAFRTWCKPHRYLKASTRTKPLMARTIGGVSYVDTDPYYPVYKPWDYNNDPLMLEE
jgi:hypothetical protein